MAHIAPTIAVAGTTGRGSDRDSGMIGKISLI